jgi:hypothetical protein
MAGITLTQAKTALAAALAAEAKVMAGQSWTWGGKSVTRADLRAIEESIDKWDARVKRLSGGGIQWKRGVLQK